MEIIREAGLPIEAACGGCCACATCHVYVDADWLPKLPAPGPDEGMMLDEAFEVRRGERIAQLVPAPVLRAHFMEVHELAETERGSGGFGSTGR